MDTEVTQLFWFRIMGNNPSQNNRKENCNASEYVEINKVELCINNPVENVTHDSVVKFINKLNKLSKEKYRLPTEEEWEYSVRKGDEKYFKYSFNDNEINAHSWYGNNSNNKTHRVGMKSSNSSGLFDMHGNVWEWTSSIAEDVSGGTRMIIKGGGFNSQRDELQTSFSRYYSSKFFNSNVGFRLVKTIEK